MNLKDNYNNIFFFDMVNQNFLLLFDLKKIDLLFFISFNLTHVKFDSYNLDLFNSYFFMEWFSDTRPFLNKNQLVSNLRSKSIYNFLIFLDFLILKFNNISQFSFINSSLIFSIKSYRLIPFLPSVFYNFKDSIIIKFRFNNFFKKLSNIQKKNYIIFFFNHINW